MTVDEAHRLIVEISAEQASGRESFAHQALVDAFDRADAAKQQKMIDACEVLALDGTAADRDVASAFLETVPISHDLIKRLIAAYRSRHLDDSSPVAGVIGRKWTMLDAGDLQTLEPIFVGAAHRQMTIGRALLYHSPDGAAWGALMAVVRASNEADVLGRAAKAASAAEKLPEFYAAMKGKSVDVRQSTGERISSANYDDYMQAVGLLSS